MSLDNLANEFSPAASEQPVQLSGFDTGATERASTQPSDTSSQEVTIQAAMASHYIGPMPPPSMLAEYDKVLPGLAERIANRFEVQSDHRMKMEASVMSADAFSQRLGTIFSGMIGLCGVGGGIYLGAIGKDVWGFATALASLASLVTAYGIGKRSHDRELQQRAHGED